MTTNTKIEWADATWNPIIGCSKVSPGCDNCYAEKMAYRIAHIEIAKKRKKNYSIVSGNGMNRGWNGKTHFQKSQLEKPLKWKKTRRIFVCSMGDLFHESIPFEWVDKVIDVVRWTKQHIYLFLTKRPERMAEYFTKHVPDKYYMEDKNFLDNLILGITAENQEQADKRIPILLSIPAAKRFVSIEPMLEPVDLTDGQIGNSLYNYLTGAHDLSRSIGNKLDWIIVGGESGHKRRECKTEWVESIINQCESCNIPVLVKQLYIDGKKASLPEINGKTYNQYPS